MNKKIILASASPRRKQILEEFNIKFEVIKPQIEEKTNLKKPAFIVKKLAYDKANEIKKKITNQKAIILSADTIVYCKGKIIGKPKNYQQAKKMLELLTENPQFVYTGFCIIDLYENKIFKGYDKTKVVMNKIPDEILDKIIEKNMDKAGCYAIQANDGLVKSIKGDYYNVVGLPIKKILGFLK